jgi:serine/threonine protein kinase
MGLEVALKRIKSSTPQVCGWFIFPRPVSPVFIHLLQLESHLKREALLMMRVSNPYIVRVLGMLPNPLSIIMELVQAGSLHDILRKRALSFEEQFNICRGVTHGLKALHAAGIWHCDLKGKNVLVDDHGVPKITDFGIARAHGPSDTLAGSSDMALAGTIEWMAPELFKKPPEFSAASDTYALGILFFEILTRETPWAKELKGEVPFARVPSWVLDGRRPQYGTVDAGLAGVMISCWKQKPNERPSLGQILEMLEAESPAARAKAKAAADAAAKAAADAEAKAAADAAAKAAADAAVKAAADAAAKAAASKAAADTAHLQQRHIRVQCPEGAQTYQAVRFPGIFVGDIDQEVC